MNERITSERAASGLVTALAAAALHASCASTRQGPSEPEPQRPIDEVLVGVPDPEMRELWRQADAAGTLPPIDAVPRTDPGDVVSVREVPDQKDERSAPRRPSLPEGTVADVQPFSSRPIAIYEGTVTIASVRPGIVSVGLAGREEPLELHCKFPGERQVLAVEEGASMRLRLRDAVVDSAQQRRIVLHDGEGDGPLLYLAEGGGERYRATVPELGLTIEQEPARGSRNPPVRVSRGGDSVVVQPRTPTALGSDDNALQILVLSSVASSERAAPLLDGQPSYVRLMVYRVR